MARPLRRLAPDADAKYGKGVQNTVRCQVQAHSARTENFALLNGAKFPGQAAGEEPAVVVRSDFRSTVFWQPDVVTDKNGSATVKVQYPDSLTTWKATARAVTEGNQFGIAETNTQTKQPLIVRLEAPRFFVVGFSLWYYFSGSEITRTKRGICPVAINGTRSRRHFVAHEAGAREEIDGPREW